MKKKHYSKMDVHGGNGKSMNEGEYAGVDARRRLEREDAKMIHEDRSAVANLPQGVIMKSYPSNYDGQTFPELNDTISGIDRQINQDFGGMKKHRSNTKY